VVGVGREHSGKGAENAGQENAAPNCRTGNARKGMYGKPNGVLHM